MYKLATPTNTIRCIPTQSRVNLFSIHIKPRQQIRTINVQQTNVTGYHGRGPRSANKSFSRAEKDRAERALLYAKTKTTHKDEESQRRFKKIPASILKAEKITEEILSKVTERNYDEALKIFQDNKKSGIQFGTRGYSLALRILVQKGDIQTAVQYFDDLMKEKVPLQVGLIDFILLGYAKANNIELVQQWFKKIEELKLAPTVHSYNPLFSVLQTEAEISNSFIELKKNGVQPNIKTYITLMRRFSQLNRFDRVWDAYTEARAHHIYPNTGFWVSIIGYCAKFGQIDYLERGLFHMVDAHDTTLDYNHWTALVRAFTSLGRWDRLYDMIEEMEKQKAPLDPQIVHAITSSVRASDLVRGYLEFPLNQVYVQASKQSKVQSPKLDTSTTKLFKGFLNDVKPVLLANVFNPPDLVSTTQAAQV